MKNKKSIKNVKQQKGLSLKKGSTSSKKILIITLISLGAIMILLGLLFFFREAIFVGKASYNQNLIGPNGFGIPLVGDYEVLPGDTNIELPIYADFGSQKTLLFEVKLSVDKNDYDNLERLKIGSNHNRVAPLSSSEITDAVNLGSLRDSTTLTRDSTTLTRDSTTLTRDSTTLTRDSSIPTIVSGSSVSKVELTSQFVVLPDNGCANAGNCPLTGKVSPVKVIFNVKSTASVGEIEVNLLEFKYYLEDGSIRSLDLAESINPAKVKVVTTTPAEDTGPHTHVVNDNIVCDEGYTTTKDLNAIRRLGGFPGCTDCAEGYVMENSLCVVPELTEDCATSADEDGDGEGSCRDSDCAGQQGSFNLPRERVRAICCQSDDDCSSGKVCGTSNACVASAALPPIEDCATSADEDGDGEGKCGDPDCAGQTITTSIRDQTFSSTCCQSDSDCNSGKVCGDSNICVVATAGSGDADGDGVVDSDDACVNVGQVDTIDTDGCPLGDDNNDGKVCDAEIASSIESFYSGDYTGEEVATAIENFYGSVGCS